jgi:hypothetical protein
MRSIVKLLMLTALFIGFSLYFGRGGNIQGVLAQSSGARYTDARPIPPYSVWFHKKDVGGDGTVTELDSFEGQRRNGDTVSAFVRNDPSLLPGTLLRSVNFAAKGITIQTNSVNNNIVTSGRGQPVGHTFNWGNCHTLMGDRWTGKTKKILGFDTYQVIENISEINDSEDWLAPAMECMALENTTTWKHRGGAYDGYSTKIATSAQAVDPPDAMFAIPDRPNEMPPSQYETALTGAPRELFERSDKFYERSRQERESGVHPPPRGPVAGPPGFVPQPEPQ